jgi:hypothetical protein
MFSENREQVTNRPRGHMQALVVTDLKIRRVEGPILENVNIKVRDIASKVRASAGSVQTFIREHLLFKNVGARCVKSCCRSTRRHSVFLCLPTT